MGDPRPQSSSKTLSLHERFLSLTVIGKELCDFLKFTFCEGLLGEGVRHFIKQMSASRHGQPEPCPRGAGCVLTSGTEAWVQSCPHRHLGKDQPSHMNFSRFWCHGLSRCPRLSNFPQNIGEVSETAPAIPDPAPTSSSDERLVRKQQLSGLASAGNSRSLRRPATTCLSCRPCHRPTGPFPRPRALRTRV